MTIHYHGTPLTPRIDLDRMRGKNLCVSFANPGDADWCINFAQSIMWDNGRFTAFTQGKVVDDAKLYAWLEAKLGHPHWAVVPDAIGGGVDDNLALIRQWPFRKDVAAVVWHLDEPIEHLVALVELGFSKICFGSAGEYWQVGSDAWAMRVDEAFNALVIAFGCLPWVHMLRGLAVCGDRWPFASADSVNVARNFKDTSSDPERMARRIDSIQCPIRWRVRETEYPEMVDFFA